jgi:hypothetical protein
MIPLLDREEDGDDDTGYPLVDGWEPEKDIKWKVSVIEGNSLTLSSNS